MVSLTHRTHLNTQLYKALQLNCEPYPPFPRTPGDLHRIARFRMNGSQMSGLGPLFLREQKTFALMLLSRMMAFIVLYHCRFYESIQ